MTTDELETIQKYKKRILIEDFMSLYQGMSKISKEFHNYSIFNINQTKRQLLYDKLVRNDPNQSPKMHQLYQYLNFKTNVPPHTFIRSIPFIFPRRSFNIAILRRFEGEETNFKDPIYFENVVSLVENRSDNIFVPLHTQLKHIFVKDKDPNRFCSDMKHFERKLKCQEMILEGSRLAQKWIQHKSKVIQTCRKFYNLLRKVPRSITKLFVYFLMHPNWILKHIIEKLMTLRDEITRYFILLKRNVSKYKKGEKIVKLENRILGIDPNEIMKVYKFQGEKTRFLYDFNGQNDVKDSIYCKEIPVRLIAHYLQDPTINLLTDPEMIANWTDSLIKKDFYIPPSIWKHQFDTNDVYVEIKSICSWIDQIYSSSIDILSEESENLYSFEAIPLLNDESNLQPVLDHFKQILSSSKHLFVYACLNNFLDFLPDPYRSQIPLLKKQVQNEIRQRQLIINTLKEYEFPGQSILTLLSDLNPHEDFEYLLIFEYIILWEQLIDDYMVKLKQI